MESARSIHLVHILDKQTQEPLFDVRKYMFLLKPSETTDVSGKYAPAPTSRITSVDIAYLYSVNRGQDEPILVILHC